MAATTARQHESQRIEPRIYQRSEQRAVELTNSKIWSIDMSQNYFDELGKHSMNGPFYKILHSVLHPAKLIGGIDKSPISSDSDDFTDAEIGSMLVRLDDKVGLLFTHVSIMIAVTVGLLAIYSKQDQNYLFIVDLIGYLYLAIVCLRCTAPDRTSTLKEDELREFLAEELTVRRNLYYFAYPMTFIMTLLLLLTILIVHNGA